MTTTATAILARRRTSSPTFLVVAALTGVSVVPAAAVGFVSAAVLALVALGAVLLWLLDCSPGLATGTLLVLHVAAWASVADLYVRVWWLDIAVHTAATAVLAAAAAQALVHRGLLGAGRPPAWLLVGAATAAGLSLGVVWEIAEWVGHTYVDDGVGVGYDDTIGDLAAGGLGSLVAGVCLAVAQGRGPGTGAVR